MGNKQLKHIMQKVHASSGHTLKKTKQAYIDMIIGIKKLKKFIMIIYQQYLCNKFVRLVMIFPMFLILLSGFIEEKKTSVYGTLSNSKNVPHLDENITQIITPIPNSGLISIDDDANIAQYKQQKPSPERLPQLALISFEGTIKQDRFIREVTIKPPLITPPPPPIIKVSKSYLQRKKSYIPFVQRYSRKYGLDPSMVIAIIHAESTFYPHLVSTQNAHGLMQVVPATAGAEVHRYFKKEGEPSSTELMHPETNIRYGTAYLYLLRRYHLIGITDPKIKDILTIASYNAGSGAVLRHFARNRTEAINQVNQMTPDEVMATILVSYRSIETRKYLKKVLTHMGSI